MDLTQLPNDPAMLMSYINTKLRDKYVSLDDLCDDMHLDKQQLADKLAQAGYEYSPQYNRFW